MAEAQGTSPLPAAPPGVSSASPRASLHTCKYGSQQDNSQDLVECLQLEGRRQDLAAGVAGLQEERMALHPSTQQHWLSRRLCRAVQESPVIFMGACLLPAKNSGGLITEDASAGPNASPLQLETNRNNLQSADS